MMHDSGDIEQDPASSLAVNGGQARPICCRTHPVCQCSAEASRHRLLLELFTSSEKDVLGDYRRFIPKGSICQSLNRKRIESHLRLLSWDDDLCSHLATIIAPENNENCTVCQKATCTGQRITFASLLRIGREDYIRCINQTAANLCDGNLPLEAQALSQASYGIRGLSEKEPELFENAQWQLRSHYLGGLVINEREVVKFDDGGVLPLVKTRRMRKDQATGSTNSRIIEASPEQQIFEVEIHQDHHNLHELNGNSNVFVLKTFRNSRFPEIAKDAFEAELLANRQVPRHDRITRLLTAFEFRDGFHLVFPFAHLGDLLRLWRNTNVLDEGSRPSWYSPQWVLRQCLGIAEALAETHQPSPGSDGICSTRPVPQLHADVKAKNVLCFQPDDSRPPFLKLADFGCSREARQDGTVDIADLASTKTYQPPEREAENNASLNYDVWCLGCLYLEFVTWAVSGYEGIVDFGSARMTTSNDGRRSKGGTDYKNDIFFTEKSVRPWSWPGLSRLGLHSSKNEPPETQTINTWQSPFSSRSKTKVRCEIKPSVTEHIARLRKNPLFQPEFARLLEIIETKMLVVKSGKRATSRDVVSLLRDFAIN
jgi:serine/threonine protein kinase